MKITTVKMQFEEDDLHVANLNDITTSSGSYFGSSQKRPHVIIIWANTTEQEAKKIREKLLNIEI